MDSGLFVKAIIKFLSGLILVGLLLFLPAGTFAYPQGWLLIGILFVPMFIAGLIMMKKSPELLRKRLSVREEQDEQKTRKAAEAYEDDSDLIRDMLLEALDLIEEAVELVSHAEALLNGEDIEADCCFPCRIMEVYCDDEL